MEGVETDGDSLEGKTALPTPTASLASRFKAPRAHCCKCMVWPESAWPRREGRGRIRATGATNDLMPFLQYSDSHKAAGFNTEGRGWFPNKPGWANSS